MKPEQLFHYPQRFELESGECLPGFQLQYSTFGILNPDRSNVIWVCHALTGSSDVLQWWDGMFLRYGIYDLKDFFVVCVNSLGSCYGSTGPLSINPETGKKFYHSFPLLTNRDIVSSFDLLRLHLGFETIHTVTGGSLGGQQAIEWAILRPAVFQHLIPMACNAVHSPWGIAFNEAQRLAIGADQTWKENRDDAGSEGMKAARAAAMISYRSYRSFEAAQTEKSDTKLDGFRASSYQQYQGQKLANRFNAFSYWTLSKAMDNHHVGRGRESVASGLHSIKAKTLVIGIEEDILFPIHEQKFIAENIHGAQLASVQSKYGHDAFLVEFDEINKALRNFYQQSLKTVGV